MKRSIAQQIVDVSNECRDLVVANPQNKRIHLSDSIHGAKVVRADPVNQKVQDVINQAFANCNYKGSIMVMFHVMMKVSNQTFGLMHDDASNATLFEERVVRYIHSHPEEKRYDLSKTILDEVKLVLSQMKLSNIKLELAAEAEEVSYRTELVHLLGLCARYGLPLREAKFNSNHMEENISIIDDSARYPSVVIRSMSTHPDRVILTVDEYSTAHETYDIFYGTPIKNFQVSIMLNTMCCIDPRQGTLIKWAVCTSTTSVHHHTILVLPPLLLRSLIAAEERYAFFQVASIKVPHVKIPKPAVALVGQFMIPLLKAAARTYVHRKSRNYYPKLESPGKFKANSIYGHSPFDLETRTDKLITFSGL